MHFVYVKSETCNDKKRLPLYFLMRVKIFKQSPKFNNTTSLELGRSWAGGGKNESPFQFWKFIKFLTRLCQQMGKSCFERYNNQLRRLCRHQFNSNADILDDCRFIQINKGDQIQNNSLDLV